MPDEEISQATDGNSDLLPTPVVPLPQQNMIPDKRAPCADQMNETSNPFAKEIHWIHHATFWSQICLGLIGIVALIIYYGQLCQMRKATIATEIAANAAKNSADLNRQLAEATQAAILECTVISQPELDKSFTFSVGVENRSKGTAKHVEGKLTASVRTWPDQNLVGAPTIISIEAPQMAGQQSENAFLSSQSKTFTLKAFNPEALYASRQTVVVEGFFKYDNGFGDIITSPICRQEVAHFNTVSGKFDDGGFSDCDRVPEALRINERNIQIFNKEHQH